MCKELLLPDSYDIYCFDYYDTVVCRTVEPEYVKKLWCRQLKDDLGLDLGLKALYASRNRLESKLCRENEAKGKDLEFQYRQLTERMYELLAEGMDISKACFIKKLEDIELEIECRVQKKCTDVTNEITRLKTLGKKVICVSDFYMSQDFMKRLLVWHGLGELFDEVYVSGEYLLTKRTGRLYEYLLQHHAAFPGQYIMIGDNPYSDFEVPKQKGMGAYLLERDVQKARYKKFCSEHEQKNYVSRRLLKLYHSCRREQFEDISFSLYCFTDQLYAHLRRENIKDVFFLSREGEFLKRLFDAYQGARTGNAPYIQSHYLMVSRKSTFIASLKQIREEDFEMVFRQYVNISLYDFLSSLGFIQKVQEEIGNRLHVDIYKKQECLPHSSLFERLLSDECFLKNYEALRIEQKQNLAQYLDTFQIDFQKDGMCLVDVGWKGTIQDNIFMFFEGKVTIQGMYVGLVNPGKVHPKNVKTGLLFSCMPNPSDFFYVYDENKSLFEVLLGASHGSADHYRKTEKGIQVVTVQKEEEKELFEKVISPMQEGIFQCFQKIDHVLINHCFEKSELECIAGGIHAKLVFFPVREQTELFYGICHYENFGVFEFTKFKRQEKVTFLKRCRNIVRMFRQRRAFFQSGYWGVVALKDAGLGIFMWSYGCYMYQKYYRRIICGKRDRKEL